MEGRISRVPQQFKYWLYIYHNFISNYNSLQFNLRPIQNHNQDEHTL